LGKQLGFGFLDGRKRYQDLVNSTHFEERVQTLGCAY